uniref:Uncharacterized protein n=1 Tax=viral metagenome TaxID=1070528 RepID=A0A6C0BL37_9ZZZZ
MTFFQPQQSHLYSIILVISPTISQYYSMYDTSHDTIYQ